MGKNAMYGILVLRRGKPIAVQRLVIVLNRKRKIRRDLTIMSLRSPQEVPRNEA